MAARAGRFPEGFIMPRWSKRSLVAQAMGIVDPVTRAVVPPIHVATTYVRDPDNAYSSGYVYGRPDNATVRQAEAVIAMLEEAEAGALLFASGMAAATSVFQALDPGDHVVDPEGDVLGAAQLAHHRGRALGPERRSGSYGGPRRAPGRRPAGPHQARLDRDARESALDPHRHRGRGRDRARRRGAARGRFDGRFARAHAPGADLVMHAATKILNGHSDLIAGALAAARADAFWERIARIRASQGAILGLFVAYLLTRGLRTLALRAAAQAQSALILAERRSAHPRVVRVLYPGLATHS